MWRETVLFIVIKKERTSGQPDQISMHTPHRNGQSVKNRGILCLPCCVYREIYVFFSSSAHYFRFWSVCVYTGSRCRIVYYLIFFYLAFISLPDLRTHNGKRTIITGNNVFYYFVIVRWRRSCLNLLDNGQIETGVGF